MVHADAPNVAKTAIRAHLAKMFKAKEEAIAIVGLHTKFGGGRSSGMALIYDNVDARKKYDMKARCIKVSSQSRIRGIQELANSAFKSKSSQLSVYLCIITYLSIY